MLLLIISALSCLLNPLVLAESQPSPTCGPMEFGRCFSAFSKVGLTEEVKNMTLFDLDRNCRMLRDSEECIKPFLHDCHSDMITTWTGMLSGLDYLCNQPRNDVLEALHCTLKDQANLKSCVKSTVYTGINHLRTKLPTPEQDRKEEICRSVQETEKCMEYVEARDCGEKAKQLFVEFYTRVSGKMLKKMNCGMKLPAEDICSPERIKHCFNDVYSMKFQNMNADKLDMFCRLFKKADDCVWTFEKHCLNDVADAVGSMRNGVGYLCSQPRDKILKHIRCHETNVEGCVNVVLRNMSMVIHSSDGANVIESCEGLLISGQCVEDDEIECVGDAYDFFTEFYERINYNNPVCNRMIAIDPAEPDIPSQNCRLDQFQKCFGDFMTNGNFQPFAKITKAVLDEKCKMFEAAEGCVWEFESHCQGQVNAIWNGLRDAFNYICSLPRDDVIRYASCTYMHQRDLSTCVQRMIGSQADVLHRGYLGDPKGQEKMCRRVANMQSCMIQVEGEQCGAGASKMFREIFKRIDSALPGNICPRPVQPTTVTKVYGESGCRSAKFRRCLSGRLIHEVLFKRYPVTEKELVSFCGSIPEIKQCYHEFRSKCSETCKAMMGGYLKGLEWLCQQRRPVVLGAVNCFIDHERELKGCIQISLESHTQVFMNHHERKSDQELKGLVCSTVKYGFECLDRIEDRYCGEDEANVMREYLSTVSEHVDHKLQCNKPSIAICEWYDDLAPNKKKLVIGLIVGGAILIISIITAICCCACMRRRKMIQKKKAEEEKNMFATNLAFTLEKEDKAIYVIGKA